MVVIESKLKEIIARSLGNGSHSSLDEGVCVMEAASYVAGEKWSDEPACVCPVIGAFMRLWNDSLPNDAERDRLLKPLITQIVDTRSTAAVEERRSYLALDWLIRVFTPKWLDLVPSLHGHAKQLRALDEIADIAGAVAAGEKVNAARAAAGDALKPTTEWLQASALDLVDRMIAITA